MVIVAWIFIVLFGGVLLVCVFTPFILSGQISEREEREEEEAAKQIAEWGSASEAIGPSRARIAEKAREAADVLPGVPL